MESGDGKLRKKFNRHSYLKQKLRAKFGSQQEVVAAVGFLPTCHDCFCLLLPISNSTRRLCVRHLLPAAPSFIHLGADSCAPVSSCSCLPAVCLGLLCNCLVPWPRGSMTHRVSDDTHSRATLAASRQVYISTSTGRTKREARKKKMKIRMKNTNWENIYVYSHGRAFLQKKAVVRQHLRLQKRILAKEKKQLHNLQNVCEEGATEVKQDKSSIDAILDNSSLSSIPRKNRPNNLRRARAAYKKKIEEKQQRQGEVTKQREEAEEAKKRYKEKRLQRFKKLSQKTKKGQPVMRGKIELMLETLQQSSNS